MQQLPGNIRVLPNPWGVNPLDIDNPRVEGRSASNGLDKDGRPSQKVFYDIHTHKMGFGFIGAEVNKKRTVVLQKLERGDDQRSAMQRTVWNFCGISAEDEELATKLAKAEPISLPASSYYIKAVAQGSLIPVDEFSAQRCGVKFRPIGPLFRQLEEYAHAGFNAMFAPGVDAIQYFRGMIQEEIEANEKQKPKPLAPVPVPVPVVADASDKKKGAQ